MPSPRPVRPAPARGIVRLLNTADGRVLCLAGDVDDAAVDSFRERYGPEPARVDAIDGGSLTALSEAGRELLLDHLSAAAREGRRLGVRRPASVDLPVEDDRGSPVPFPGRPAQPR